MHTTALIGKVGKTGFGERVAEYVSIRLFGGSEITLRNQAISSASKCSAIRFKGISRSALLRPFE